MGVVEKNGPGASKFKEGECSAGPFWNNGRCVARVYAAHVRSCGSVQLLRNVALICRVGPGTRACHSTRQHRPSRALQANA